MKKTIAALLLVLVMVLSSVGCFAASASDINTADALNELELFLGTGKGYELDKGLTRAQGVVLLVRMIGMEETAENGIYDNDFTDVDPWAAAYIGYAFENGITNGTGATTFSPDKDMTDYMFLTLVLRALNYSDKGDEPMFAWNNPYALACELGLVDTTEPDADFTRADAIKIFWNALDVALNGEKTTLAARLIDQKVFTAAELAAARDIQKNGRKENAGVPIIPDAEPDIPVTPDVPVTPDTPDVPTTPDEPDEPGDGGGGVEDNETGRV